jgi:hypothetical protein
LATYMKPLPRPGLKFRPNLDRWFHLLSQE